MTDHELEELVSKASIRNKEKQKSMHRDMQENKGYLTPKKNISKRNLKISLISAGVLFIFFAIYISFLHLSDMVSSIGTQHKELPIEADIDEDNANKNKAKKRSNKESEDETSEDSDLGMIVTDTINRIKEAANSETEAATLEAIHNYMEKPDISAPSVSVTDSNVTAGGVSAENAQQAWPALNVNMDSEITYIRALYKYTNDNQGLYSVGADPFGQMGNGQFYYYGNVPVKSIVKNGTITAESYYMNPGMGDYVEGITTPEQHLKFVFAYDSSNENEFRFYFKDRQIIRYIGPDHVENDFIDGVSLEELMKMANVLNGGTYIYTVLSMVTPEAVR